MTTPVPDAVDARVCASNTCQQHENFWEGDSRAHLVHFSTYGSMGAFTRSVSNTNTAVNSTTSDCTFCISASTKNIPSTHLIPLKSPSTSAAELESETRDANSHCMMQQSFGRQHEVHAEIALMQLIGQ